MRKVRLFLFFLGMISFHTTFAQQSPELQNRLKGILDTDSFLAFLSSDAFQTFIYIIIAFILLVWVFYIASSLQMGQSGSQSNRNAMPHNAWPTHSTGRGWLNTPIPQLAIIDQKPEEKENEREENNIGRGQDIEPKQPRA